jgi:nitrite reductase/ring-hydroxylating ferredoxin subunit
LGGGMLDSGWRWLQKYGLGVPIVLGVVMVVVLVVFFALGSGFRDPERIEAGSLDDYEIGKPIYFEVDRFWIVRVSDEELVALYDKDPHSRCQAFWYVNEEFMGTKGWFNEPCMDFHYDYAGNCFDERCERGLDQFPVSVDEDGTVVMNVSRLRAGVTYEPLATPLVPPGSD